MKDWHDETAKRFADSIPDNAQDITLNMKWERNGDGYRMHYVAVVTTDGYGITEPQPSQEAAADRYTEIDIARIKRETFTMNDTVLWGQEIEFLKMGSVGVGAVEG